jgi:quinol monooxygenase YgiN
LKLIINFSSKLRRMSDNSLVVLLKYKAQPGQGAAAITALRSLIKEVAREPHYVQIDLLVDPADDTQIMLHEVWASESYYKGEHMNTPHLQQFMGEARAFLAGPPDISFWKAL